MHNLPHYGFQRIFVNIYMTSCLQFYCKHGCVNFIDASSNNFVNSKLDKLVRFKQFATFKRPKSTSLTPRKFIKCVPNVASFCFFCPFLNKIINIVNFL